MIYYQWHSKSYKHNILILNKKIRNLTPYSKRHITLKQLHHQSFICPLTKHTFNNISNQQKRASQKQVSYHLQIIITPSYRQMNKQLMSIVSGMTIDGFTLHLNNNGVLLYNQQSHKTLMDYHHLLKPIVADGHVRILNMQSKVFRLCLQRY